MAADHARQLSFDLPFRPAMGREDFMVSECNAAAVAAVDALAAGETAMLVLVGPAGAGKTHLAEVWRQAAGAVAIAAGDLSEEAAAGALACGACVVEDLPPRDARAEAVFFHLINAAVQGRIRLLMTSRTPPPAWPLSTEDVRTRLRLAGVAEIALPDDALFAALILKLMADRQMTAAANAVRYALPRLERSFEAAERFVAAVERASVEKRRTVTLGVVREVIAGQC